MYKILSKEMLSPAICRMKVSAPRLAAAAAPGQFLIVRTDEHGERIPLTISDFDAEEGSVTIVTQQIGASTKEICALEEGDSFMDVVGPLGLPSEFVHMSDEELEGERYIFIAGGVGTAPVYPQVKYLKSRGSHVDVIIGAKTKDLLIYRDEMSAVCDNLFICTDDGSEGFKGMVTGLLEKIVLEDGRKYTQAVAIGPKPPITPNFIDASCYSMVESVVGVAGYRLWSKMWLLSWASEYSSSSSSVSIKNSPPPDLGVVSK